MLSSPTQLHRRVAGTLLAAAVLSAVSCSDSAGPPPLRTGTPAYYFQTAKDAYAKGDYLKATEWLDKITKSTKNEFTGRAWTFRLLLESGLIAGYTELAENYEYGRRSNKDNPTPFIKKVTEYRGMATRMTMPFAEHYAEYVKSAPDSSVEIDFPFPAAGTTTKPQQLSNIAQGRAPDEGSVDSALRGMLSRGVVTAICDTLGAKDDAAKGRAALQTLPAKVPRSAFELVLAKALYQSALLHGSKFSGAPGVQEFLCQQGLSALGSVTDTGKEAKALKANLEKELKDAKKRKG